MNPRSLIAGLALLLAAGAVQAGVFAPAMETYLAAKAAGEPLKALVLLEDRVDIQTLDWQLHAARTNRADRHLTVVTTLQDQARATQASLLADLEVRRRLGEIESYEPFWIVNGVFVTGGDETMLRELAARPDVALIEPPLAIELIEPVRRGGSGDPTLAIGITPGVVNVKARRVWSDLGIDGTGALVANLDTGVDGNHPALASRWRGTHAPASACWLDLDGAPSSFPSDGNSHGTHTMGTICGLAPDDTIGVAPGAEWIAANTIVGGSLDANVLVTMQWLADPDGDPYTVDDVPDVANNSWGVHEGFGYPDCYSGWWEAIDACEAAGVMHVWATGNEGPGASTVRSPADRATTLYDSFSVGSTLRYPPYQLSGFSSRGPAGPDCGPAENLTKPEVVAPGSGIYSSIPGGGYTYMDGTSMATPHVAGLVALIRAANPDLDVITIKQIMMDTAVDLGIPGEENLYGHGFIDCFAAVSAALAGYGAVAGTVVDQASDEPIAGALVTVAGSGRQVVTDQAGEFRLSAPAGPLTFTVSAFGYAVATVDVDVPAGGEANPEIALLLLPQVTLQGTAFAPDGAPAADVLIQAADTPLPTVSSGPGGDWSLLVPQGADYTLRATLPGVATCVQTLPADRDRDCPLYLRANPEDGFESGALDAFAWSGAGNVLWTVTSVGAYEGQYCARSGVLGANQTSILLLTANLTEAGDVRFWLRTQGGGALEFWDGFAIIQAWTDAPAWTQFSYAATAGAHTFRWRFTTPSSGGSGDVGFVDLVSLPGGAAPAPRGVPCPQAVSVAAEPGAQTTAELLVLNEGVADLTWSLVETSGWLDVAPAAGTLAAAGYAVVALAVDATTLGEGTYATTLTLASNDPAYPSLLVPVELIVGEVSTPVEAAPPAFALVGAVPNPFNPQTTLRFTLPAAEVVRLRVFDVQGRLVRELVDGPRPAGLGEVLWDGRDRSGRSVASGTYFARLEAGGLRSVKSLVLVR